MTAALPVAEQRPGQQQKAQAVADAIASKKHLVVQVGTGHCDDRATSRVTLDYMSAWERAFHSAATR